MGEQLKGTLLVILAGVFYGTTGYFATILNEEGLSVEDLLLWRFLGSALLLAPIVPSFFKRRVSPQQWRTLGLFFVLGALCYSLGTILYFHSSFIIGTGLSMVLYFSYPLLVVAWLAFIEKRLPSFLTILSVMLLIVGCGMIGLGDKTETNWYGFVLSFRSRAALARREV